MFPTPLAKPTLAAKSMITYRVTVDKRIQMTLRSPNRNVIGFFKTQIIAKQNWYTS
jgi:hypothetical protein